MTKRKGRKGNGRWAKRAKVSLLESAPDTSELVQNKSPIAETYCHQVKLEDTIENKVDIIIKDLENNSCRSVTIWGTGLGVEKTIAAVEALKRNFVKLNTRYTQETSINALEDGEARLQVILTLKGPEIKEQEMKA